MRILSWNLNVRRCCVDQVATIAGTETDVAILQEVTDRSWLALKPEFEGRGYAHTATARELNAPATSGRSMKRFVAIASRVPFVPLEVPDLPAPDPLVRVLLSTATGPIDLIGVHIPTAAHADKLLKIETQEVLIAHLARPGQLPRILCGDFNSPKAEQPDGTVVPFYIAKHARHHDAERRLMGRTTEAGLVDVFRSIHGYDREAASWWWKNRGKTGGYRLDHIFASPELRASACEYVDEWRLSGLSDHAAIYADFPNL
jgi:exonuclease III